MIIRLRGRKKTPITWSPASETGVKKLSQLEITPPKDTPTRAMLGLRSSPRKRLQLNDTKEMATNTTPLKKSHSNPALQPTCNKRPKLEGPFTGSKCPLEMAVTGLSKTQLIDLIQKMASLHPELRAEMEEMLPEPDLKPIDEHLTYLKKNIFKCLPNNRLTSKTDSAAFNKASVHLNALKKAVVESGKQLVESGSWNSVFDYTMMAWSHVRATPVWDNAQHNTIRRQCFKTLSSYCLYALRNLVQEWDTDTVFQVKQKLERLRVDSEDVEACLSYLNSNTATNLPAESNE